MFKRNHISVAIAAAAILISSSALATDFNGVATITVTNAFTITEDQALSFGVLRVSQGAAQAATTPTFINLPVDGSVMVPTKGVTSGGTVDATDGNMTALSQGTVGRYIISAAAPNSTLTVTVEGGNTETDDGGAVAGRIVGMNDIPILSLADGTPAFRMYAGFSNTLITGGSGVATALTVTGTGLETDSAGTVTLSIGAVLAYDATATTAPADGDYEGAYALTINY